MNRVRIIIVNWNAGALLQNCLVSIKAAECNDFELERIVVVDNASTDNSLDGLERLGLPLEVIRNTENLGFASACNQGARGFTGEYVLFLNPDTCLYPRSLFVPLAFLQKQENAGVGICGIQLIDEQGFVARSCARFPLALTFFLQATGLNKLLWLRQFSLHMTDWSHSSTQRVDHVIGAFFVVRYSLFQRLKGFDERFFVYLEDLDFSYRAHRAGWKSVYLADVQAFHAGGGTSKQIKAQRLFYSLRSRMLYAAKHFNKFSAACVFIFTLLIEPFTRSVFALARRSWSSFKETWQGYALLWKWLPQWILKGVTR